MKKRLLTILLLTSLTNLAFSQEQSDNAYNVVRYLQLKPNQSAKFYEIDNTGQIQTDTVFIASEFFQFKKKYIEEINNVTYVIITFPNFIGETNSDKQKNITTPSVMGVPLGTVRVDLSDKYNGKVLCIPLTEYEKLQTINIYRRNFHVTGGVLTLPFKFRGAVGSTPRSMTTDVTIGPYVGSRVRLSKKSDFFLTVPFTLGLSFINVNNGNTTVVNPQATDNSIVPGFTIGTGLVFQLNKYELGIIGGYDFGTGKSGNEWIYNEKPWVSFAIGYSFLK